MQSEADDGSDDATLEKTLMPGARPGIVIAWMRRGANRIRAFHDEAETVNPRT
jgi:hypothetical protein